MQFVKEGLVCLSLSIPQALCLLLRPRSFEDFGSHGARLEGIPREGLRGRGATSRPYDASLPSPHLVKAFPKILPLQQRLVRQPIPDSLQEIPVSTALPQVLDQMEDFMKVAGVE
jgi:hypothetical protein